MGMPSWQTGTPTEVLYLLLVEQIEENIEELFRCARDKRQLPTSTTSCLASFLGGEWVVAEPC